MMDHANTFGKGKSATSKLLYFYSLSIALDCMSNEIPSGIVYDLGGGNGLSKRWFDNNQVVTVDNNPDMKPDICSNINTYNVPPDASMVLMRHVLHYLTDDEIKALINRVTVPILLIQFTNKDIKAKQAQTKNEDHKTFRTLDQVLELLYDSTKNNIKRLYKIDYTVEPDFYVERFGVMGKSTHDETLCAWWIK